MNEDRLRIGDAERDAAAAALGEHFAQGRLTADEHHERLDAVWAARTGADLAPVFADLPMPTPTSILAPSPSVSATPRTGIATDGPGRRSRIEHRRRGLPYPAAPVVVAVVVALLAVTLVTHVPVIAVGLLVLWLLAHHHRGPHRAHGGHHHPHHHGRGSPG